MESGRYTILFKNPSWYAEYTTKWKNELHGRDRLSVDSNWRFWLHLPGYSKADTTS